MNSGSDWTDQLPFLYINTLALVLRTSVTVYKDISLNRLIFLFASLRYVFIYIIHEGENL